MGPAATCGGPDRAACRTGAARRLGLSGRANVAGGPAERGPGGARRTGGRPGLRRSAAATDDLPHQSAMVAPGAAAGRATRPARPRTPGGLPDASGCPVAVDLSSVEAPLRDD